MILSGLTSRHFTPVTNHYVTCGHMTFMTRIKERSYDKFMISSTQWWQNLSLNPLDRFFFNFRDVWIQPMFQIVFEWFLISFKQFRSWLDAAFYNILYGSSLYVTVPFRRCQAFKSLFQVAYPACAGDGAVPRPWLDVLTCGLACK